jgi:hypothetical protein
MFLKNESARDHNREVRADRIRESVGAENTFSSDLSEFGVLVAELAPPIDKVWRHCEGTHHVEDVTGQVVSRQ